MSRLTRDGTVEPVSRDQILRRERGQGNINFPCSADHVQDWQPYPVDPCSRYMCDHTWKMEHENTAEINSLLLTEISGSWRTPIIGMVEIKTQIILGKLFLSPLPSCRQRMVLFALLVHSKSCLRKLPPLWAPDLQQLLRDHVTRDTDKPEVQPVSEPESLQSCVLS